MKYYVEFGYENKDTGQFVESCGSDSIYILDGRNNLQTMIQDAINRAYFLRNVQQYTAFKIMRGSRIAYHNCCLHTQFGDFSNDK